MTMVMLVMLMLMMLMLMTMMLMSKIVTQIIFKYAVSMDDFYDL